MEKHYKQLTRRIYRFFRHPNRRKGGGVSGWIATKLFDRALWVPRRHPFVNGLATGLFLAMTPMFLPQSVIAILVCIRQRWNIPPAYAACWLTNVATWVPQVYCQIMIGTWVLERIVLDSSTALAREEFFRRVGEWWGADERWRPGPVGEVLDPKLLGELAVPWFIGILITGVVLAAAGLAIGHALWGFFGRREDLPLPDSRRSESGGGK